MPGSRSRSSLQQYYQMAATFLTFQDGRSQYREFIIIRHKTVPFSDGYFRYFYWSMRTAIQPRFGSGYKHLWKLLKRLDDE